MTDQPPGQDYRVPVPREIKDSLQGIGEVIGAQLPEGWGFALLIFTYNHEPGQEGTMTWRADMLRAVSEFIAKNSNA